MASQQYSHLNGAAIAAARVPFWQSLATEMKLAAVIGSAIAAFVIPVGIALHAGGYIGAVKTQDITDLSGKFDKLSDKMDTKFAELKKESQREKVAEQNWRVQLQDDVSSLRSDNRAFAVAIEELKVKVSAPPLPVRKQPSRPKTAANTTPKSLMIFGK